MHWVSSGRAFLQMSTNKGALRLLGGASVAGRLHDMQTCLTQATPAMGEAADQGCWRCASAGPRRRWHLSLLTSLEQTVKATTLQMSKNQGQITDHSAAQKTGIPDGIKSCIPTVVTEQVLYEDYCTPIGVAEPTRKITA